MTFFFAAHAAEALSFLCDQEPSGVPRAETACGLCRSSARKTEGQRKQRSRRKSVWLSQNIMFCEPSNAALSGLPCLPHSREGLPRVEKDGSAVISQCRAGRRPAGGPQPSPTRESGRSRASDPVCPAHKAIRHRLLPGWNSPKHPAGSGPLTRETIFSIRESIPRSVVFCLEGAALNARTPDKAKPAGGSLASPSSWRLGQSSKLDWHSPAASVLCLL